MAGRTKVWTDEKLDRVKDLTRHNSAREIGEIFGTTKNAILGALYRDKVKNAVGFQIRENKKISILLLTFSLSHVIGIIRKD